MKRYPKYKDSGVEWLKEIPEHWNLYKVSRSFYLIGSGTTPKAGESKYYNEGTINYVITGDLNDSILYKSSTKITKQALEDYSTLKIFPKGTVLIAMYGATIGKAALMEFEGCTNQACCALFKSKYLDNKFTLYWFIAQRRNIVNLSYGGGQPNISQQIIRSLIIPAPSLEEQKAIAHFLDHKLEQIEQYIRNKQRLIELLNEQKTAIINRAVTKGINPNAPMKHSGIEWLGEIPAHWDIRKIKQVCTVKGRLGFRGYTVADLVHEDEGALALGATQIKSEGEIDLSEPVYISWEKYYESPEIMINQYNIVIVQRGSTCGKVGFISENIGYATINPSLVLLKDIQIIPKYLFYFLSSSLIKKIVDSLLNSTAIPMLSQKQISNFPIFCPPTTEILEIVDHLDQSLEKVNSFIAQIEKEIELIQEYRTTLISDAVTGKIDVRGFDNGSNSKNSPKPPELATM